MRINGKIIKWRRLGEGGFNKTAVSEEPFEQTINGVTFYQYWVIKVPKAFRNEELSRKMNAPSRAVRIWNTLHPETPAIGFREMRGWLAPYKGQVAATDEETALQQLEDYRIHRRVFADACGYKNYLNVDGVIECIDVDVSRHRDSPIGQRIDKEIIELGNPKSVYNPYWQDYTDIHDRPLSVQMTKTLLYLEQQLDANDILDCYLIPEVINTLHRYQRQDLNLSANKLQRIFHNVTQHSQQASDNHSSQRFFSPHTSRPPSETNTVYEDEPSGLCPIS